MVLMLSARYSAIGTPGWNTRLHGPTTTFNEMFGSQILQWFLLGWSCWNRPKNPPVAIWLLLNDRGRSSTTAGGGWIPRPSGVFSGVVCWSRTERGFFFFGGGKRLRLMEEQKDDTQESTSSEYVSLKSKNSDKNAGYLQSDRRSASKKAHEMHQ